MTNSLFTVFKFVNLDYSEQIQHAVEIDLFTDSKLVLRLYEIIKQKFEVDSTSESSAFYFEIRKTKRQICVDYIIYTDKSWITVS